MIAGGSSVGSMGTGGGVSLNAGTLSEGAQADITVIDPELEWTVDEKKFYTKGSHSPFVGRKLKGKAVLTMVKGKVVMQDGKVLD